MHRCTPRPCQPRCQYLPFSEHITRFPKHFVHFVFSKILNSGTSAPSCAPSSWPPWTSPAWSWPAPASAPGRRGRPAPPPAKKTNKTHLLILSSRITRKGSGLAQRKEEEVKPDMGRGMQWNGEGSQLREKVPEIAIILIFSFFAAGNRIRSCCCLLSPAP